MRRRPAVAISTAAIALLTLLAFGVIAAGSDAPASATDVPTSIPLNGVSINSQWVVMPTVFGDEPALDSAQAIDIASACKDRTLVPPTALLARVTVPGTIPPPDFPVPFRTIEDLLAWVVTFTLGKPVNASIGGKPLRPGESEPPPLWVTHYSAVLDANAGEFLMGFVTA